MMWFIDFIYSLPPLVLRVFLTTLFTSLLFIGTHIVLRYFPPSSDDSDAIIGLSATVTFIYTIFFGFVIFFSINNYNNAQTEEANEALLVNTISYEAGILGEPLATHVHQSLVQYLDAAVNKEWPAAREGHLDQSASVSLDMLTQLVARYKPIDAAQVSIWTNLIQQINALHAQYDTRADASSGSTIGRSIWLCLIMSTFVMLLSNIFYSFNQRREQFILLFCIGSVSASLIFLEISIDSPYRGFYAIPSDHLQTSLASIQKMT